MPESRRLACGRCGADFRCEPGGDCWCMHLDVRLPMPAAGQDCVCADCLRAAARAPPSAHAIRKAGKRKGAK
jgi:Cysteine-rich CWC